MYNDESVLENHHLAVAFKLTHPGATPGRGRSLLSTVALLLWCRVGAGVDVQRRVGAGEPSPGGGVQTDPPGGNTGAWAESAVYGCVVVVQGRSWR